jgi:hypothetical protein
MSSSIDMNTNYNRKKTLLKFLLGNQQEQPALFQAIIYNELEKRKKFMNELNPEYNKHNDELSEIIYTSKLKEVERQTKILKEQILASTVNQKYKSYVSIIERKLYIVEMQIDIGVYNILKNKNVKFYFEV